MKKRDSFSRALKILLVTDILVLVAGAMIIPYYTLIVERVGGDILDASLAAGVFALVAGATTLVAGRTTDKIVRKERLIGVSYLVMAISFSLYTLVSSIWMLLMVQVLIGLAQAAYAPAFDALYTKHIGKSDRVGSRWSLWEAGNYFAIAIGVLGGGLVIKFLGFNYLFMTMAALCLLSAVYLLLLPRRTL